jgi:hypothetical protein
MATSCTNKTVARTAFWISQEYQRLNIGDVLKFGESTRLYIVAGPAEELPEEYDSENLRRLRLKAHLQNKVLYFVPKWC